MVSIPLRRTLAVGFVAALTAGSALAQGTPAQGTPPPMRYTGSSGPALMKALESTAAKLKLTSSQQALLDQAKATSRDARAQARAMRSAADASGETAVDAAAHTADQRAALRESVHAAWQKVYDSLDPGQRAIVNDAMHQARAEHRAARAGAEAAPAK
ncbi:MAG: Spy/CpxP family protein refolding chaperone [Proteobacteria bacterium]|nr:Spy/CpxP family protein refolding chaperone [Pseudomonadota bacterium]